MRNFQSITKETTIPQHVVGEFIWSRGINIKKTTGELNLDNISLTDDYTTAGPKIDEEGRRVVSISGYPTNVYQAMADVKYKYCDILEWDVLFARGFKVEGWEIIVDLPNGLKGVVKNVWKIANNQIKTAKINERMSYIQKTVDMQVLDIIMLEDWVKSIDEFLEQQQNSEPTDFAKKLMSAIGQTVEKKSEKKRNNYFNVEVLPQIKEKTIIDKEQIPHFIWSKWKNIKFLQDKFNVILKINNRKVEIIGSEVCVMEAKKEIERIYKDTVVEAEIICRSWWFIEIKLPNWNEKGISIDCSDKKLTNGVKVQVIIFDKGGYWEKIELLEVVDNNSDNELLKLALELVEIWKKEEQKPIYNYPKNWISEIEVKVFCRINATNIVLKMPEGFNKRISINPDSNLNDGDRVKIKVNKINGNYESVELID